MNETPAVPSSPNAAEVLAFLRAHLPELPWIDQPALSRRLQTAERALGRGESIEEPLSALVTAFEQSAALLSARRSAACVIEYPPALPVSAHPAEIKALIAREPVVIVAGETGSGKTTQLPKMLLELGFGVKGQIGHTQPRRIAARNVASRLAEELHAEGSGVVGYKVRFADQTRPQSRVVVMTDGILLAELHRDPDLLRYDALIIDEAHERSLNIDFLLGVVRRLLDRRPEFRLVITSATIDTDRFAAHFARVDARGERRPAPVVTVPGRSFPVEIRYRPPAELWANEEEGDLAAAVAAVVEEWAAERPAAAGGDVLVFLPGEREIRECADRLARHGLRHTEILPLYARLSAAEQQKVFAPHTGRRIILSTNVAETSLTVPGIVCVIDAGLARVARYSPRSRVQKLGIEPISQASANQRAGRCGRVAPGVCIRLYAAEDFAGRPQFTDPEILRTNLASVVLRLIDLRLGEPESFPFIEPPDSRQLAGARRLLFELGALDERQRITALGRQLARLPIDPTLGRMVLAALAKDAATAIDVLIVVAFLSIQDPRERPAEQAPRADEAHARFRVADSDFASVLALWSAWHAVVRHESQRQRRAWAKQHFLSYNRLLEWHDLFGQLRQAADELGAQRLPDPPPFAPDPAQPEALDARVEALHQAMLPGLLAHIALRDEASRHDKHPPKDSADARGKKQRTPTVYLGANQRKLQIFPGSALAKTQPKWLMSAEIVETARVYARMNAAINPRWIEPLAAHLTTREYSEPHWDASSGRVVAFETVRLFGLPIVTKRRVDFGRIDALAARELFIRAALVGGEVQQTWDFLKKNQALIDGIRELEARNRRPDLLIDDQTLMDFYQARLPAGVYDALTLSRWLKTAPADALFMTEADALTRDPLVRDPAGFPDRLTMGALSLPLAYHFAPGSPDDGVTLRFPLAALAQIDAARGSFLIPGLLREKIEALIRSLPKADRRHFVPAPEFAAAVAERVVPSEGGLTAQVASVLSRMTGHRLAEDAFDERKLEPHLRLRYAVIDEAGQETDADRDLAALIARHAEAAERAFAERTRHRIEHAQFTGWTLDVLPESLPVEELGARLTAYPALVDQGEAVAVRLLDTPARAAYAHRAGVTRLLLLALPELVRHLGQMLKQDRTLDAARLHYGQWPVRPLPEFGLVLPARRDAALDFEVIARSVAELAVDEQPLVRDAATFAERVERLRPALADAVMARAEAVRLRWAAHQKLRQQIKGRLPLSHIEAAREIAEQCDALFYPGMIWFGSAALFQELPRYLAAAEKRLEKIDRHPERDRMLRVGFMPTAAAVYQRWAAVGRCGTEFLWLQTILWMLEEARIAQFVQEMARKGAPTLKDLSEALK
ncbi:ATP-dependent RNA helicase HrpA [Halothiobacillus sp. DCM-1]|uniref:ATP-dependent RNA helicase HrpA n=1 Tax=Halothiobacillus sp. DCM-1 TaxID=3112558 RepID=UPI00324B0E31